MSKNSSVTTEKPGTGVLRMARVNFFLLPMFHAVQFLSFIILIISCINGITDFFHHCVIEIQIRQAGH